MVRARLASFGLGALLVAIGLAACSSESPATIEADAQTRDGSVSTEDGAIPPPEDAAPTPADADVKETGPTGDILGTLSGSCGQITAEIGKPTPSAFSNVLAFAVGDTFDKANLSDGGDRILDTPNAGGSSIESEVMSFEILHYCEGAKLLKTEKEIVYQPVVDGGPSTITDLLVEIDGKKVGVNPIRVYKPQNQPQPTDADVKKSLEDKLTSIRGSSARVTPADKWVKQIMHVYTASQANTDAVMRVLPTIDAATRADTVVLVTRATGGGFLFCGTTRAPVGQECP